MDKDAINTQLLVECLAQMALVFLVFLEQKRDTPTTVVEAGAGVSEEHEALVNLALTEVGAPRGQARYILRRELEQTSLPPRDADRGILCTGGNSTMTTYRVELVRSPGLTDDERRHRLKQAFDVLLSFEVKETADGDTLAGEPSAAIAPDPKGRDTGEIVADE